MAETVLEVADVTVVFTTDYGPASKTVEMLVLFPTSNHLGWQSCNQTEMNSWPKLEKRQSVSRMLASRRNEGRIYQSVPARSSFVATSKNT